MPNFNVNAEFELFCSECGAGICNNADERTSRKREMTQFVVKPCSCQTDKVSELEAEIEYLKHQLKGATND